MNCKKCNTEVNSNYCKDCGQPTSLKRIDRHYIIHEIGSLLQYERGILYTIKQLFTNPGQNIRIYLTEDRSRLVKPVYFIIVTSLFYSLCNYFFHFEDGYVKYLDGNKSTTAQILKWIQGNYGYANIIMGVFIAFCTKLFFKKHKFNFFEILILLCYVMGIGMLIYSVFGIIQGLTHFKMMQVGIFVGFIYTTWAVGHFFDKSKPTSYIKAFFAYILGFLIFEVAAVVLGIFIDKIIK